MGLHVSFTRKRPTGAILTERTARIGEQEV